MTYADKARELLAFASRTKVGREAMRACGYELVVDAPFGGDDEESITAAEEIANYLLRYNESL